MMSVATIQVSRTGIAVQATTQLWHLSFLKFSFGQQIEQAKQEVFTVKKTVVYNDFTVDGSPLHFTKKKQCIFHEFWILYKATQRQ